MTEVESLILVVNFLYLMKELLHYELIIRLVSSDCRVVTIKKHLRR